MAKMKMVFSGLALLMSWSGQAVWAQSDVSRSDTDSATAIRCELRTARSPDTIQVMYFYVSDARRSILETDGTPLGNVVQFSRQRVVITKNTVDGGARHFVFDRMIGALTISNAPMPGSRESWTLSGDCQKVDASHQKF